MFKLGTEVFSLFVTNVQIFPLHNISIDYCLAKKKNGIIILYLMQATFFKHFKVNLMNKNWFISSIIQL